MRDFESLGRELQRLGKTEKLKSIAESDVGKSIGKMFDAQSLEKAAKSGDTQTLHQVLSQVLSTEEGRKLAQSLKEAMEN